MKKKFEVQLYDRTKRKPSGSWTYLTEKQMLKFVKKHAKVNRITIEGLEFATEEQKKKLKKVI